MNIRFGYNLEVLKKDKRFMSSSCSAYFLKQLFRYYYPGRKSAVICEQHIVHGIQQPKVK